MVVSFMERLPLSSITKYVEHLISKLTMAVLNKSRKSAAYLYTSAVLEIGFWVQSMLV